MNPNKVLDPPSDLPLIEDILKNRPEVFKEIYARLEQAKQEGASSPPTWYYCGDGKWGSPEMKAFTSYHNTRRATFILKNDICRSRKLVFCKCTLLAICEGMVVDSEGNLSLAPKDQAQENTASA